MIRLRIAIIFFLGWIVTACQLVPAEQDFAKFLGQAFGSDQGAINPGLAPSFTPYPTYTPYSTYTPYPTYTPFAAGPGSIQVNVATPSIKSPIRQEVEGIIARNNLGEMESNGVKVELVRAVIGNSEALRGKFPELAEGFSSEHFYKSNVLMQLMYRITNNTNIVLGYDTESGGFTFINAEQINLDEYLFILSIGNTDGTIYPGNFIEGGYWLPVSSLEDVSEARSIGLGLDPLYNPEGEDVTDRFLISAKVDPSSWGYEELPDTLK